MLSRYSISQEYMHFSLEDKTFDLELYAESNITSSVREKENLCIIIMFKIATT